MPVERMAVEEGLAEPLLIGRPETIRTKIRELGLRLSEGRDYRVVNVDGDAYLGELAEDYYQLRRRQGLTRDAALTDMRRNNTLAAMNVVMLPNQTVFISDTYNSENPIAEGIAEIALLAVDEVRRFGVTPRVVLLSHSSFGSAQTTSAVKMREALKLTQGQAPNFEVEGEMHGYAALNKGILDRLSPARA